MALSTTDLQGGTGGGLPKTIAPGDISTNLPIEQSCVIIAL